MIYRNRQPSLHFGKGKPPRCHLLILVPQLTVTDLSGAP
jgi:hypothetical protein